MLLLKAVGSRGFTLRQRSIVHEVRTSLGPQLCRAMARFAEPSPSSLPSRARQVLRCRLEGGADKQIAARLRNRRLTVNQYVKRAFGHFGVQGRTERLAHWVRRRRGARFGRGRGRRWPRIVIP